MTSKKEPKGSRIQAMQASLDINLQDPLVVKNLKTDPIPEAMQELIDKSIQAVAIDDKLSEEGLNMIAQTFKLTYIYGLAKGKKSALEELKSSTQERNPKRGATTSILTKLFGKK